MWANFVGIFDHSSSKRSVFKTEQYIENLKHAQDAQMMGLKDRQNSSHIPPKFLHGVKKQI